MEHFCILGSLTPYVHMGSQRDNRSWFNPNIGFGDILWKEIKSCVTNISIHCSSSQLSSTFFPTCHSRIAILFPSFPEVLSPKGSRACDLGNTYLPALGSLSSHSFLKESPCERPVSRNLLPKSLAYLTYPDTPCRAWLRSRIPLQLTQKEESC